MTKDKMVGWHHQLNGYESEQTPEDGDGQGSLACCCPFGCKESDTAERLNKLVVKLVLFLIRNGNGDIYRALAGNEICALRGVLAKDYLKFQSVLQKQVLLASPRSLKCELQTCLLHTRQ